MGRKALILVAHGSRRHPANQEVVRLAQKLASERNDGPVFHAFLDPIAHPNIPEVIDTAIENGATHITLLPYFLNSGNHVETDIPAIVREKQTEYPNISIVLTMHVGAHPDMVNLLQHILDTQLQ